MAIHFGSPRPSRGVAAVEGHAVAGGLELAAWCDLRSGLERYASGRWRSGDLS